MLARPPGSAAASMKREAATHWKTASVILVLATTFARWYSISCVMSVNVGPVSASSSAPCAPSVSSFFFGTMLNSAAISSS